MGTGVGRALLGFAVVLAVVLCGGADAQARSTDSEAPPNAPPHWLAPEAWVYNHWLPYDEDRLYALLRADRGDIWRRLRDDRNNIAQLAARRGWRDPARLAAALIRPREPGLSARRIRALRRTALRTLTQGHLAQHVFFHSLHQFAIPSEAPSIFGVSDAEFRRLRRGEQSPLEIGRLHGRSPARIEQLSAAVLRERVRAGVRSRAMTRRQGRILLRRQLSQLPRWLAQVRYNGPPTTHRGKLIGKPRDYAANPMLSGNGARVVFEAYQQRLPLALTQGEISVASQAVGRGSGGLLDASQPSAVRRTPRSAYNPSVSRDGRFVAFESAEGNLNFAKRYGQIKVFVRDTVGGRTRAVGHRTGAGGLSRSEYNPALAADGSRVAFQAVRRGGQSSIWVCDLKTGRAQLASRTGRHGPGADAAVYEPAISGDGGKVAFTSAASNLGAGNLRARTQVFVRDVAGGATVLASRADGARGAVADGYSSEPSISRDGRYVAFASAAGNLGGAPSRALETRIYVRDLEEGRTLAVTDARDGFALNPSLSGDGRRVAYTSIVRGGVARVLVRDVRGGAARLVSRAAGADGAPADGPSNDPSISADGRRVAFSSLAPNLAAGKPDDRRGVFVRDIERATTTLVSAAVAPGAAAGAGSDGAGAQSAAAGTRRARALSRARVRRAAVSIVDNAFHRGSDRPLVRLRRGGLLRWRWDSVQSHRVMVRSGPLRLRSPTRNDGSFTARLSRPGRYVFVCSIHAPGMRMIVDVR